MEAWQDGAQYEGERFTGGGAPGATLTAIEFTDCTFERLALSGATFRHCRFTDCRFTSCDLSLVRLPNCYLTRVTFVRSKLIGIDWTAAAATDAARALFAAGFEHCTLDYGNFHGLPLTGAALVACSLREATLTEADLSGADCHDSDFAGATFLRTNLTGANLIDARDLVIHPLSNSLHGARVSLPTAIALLAALDIIVEM